MWIAIAAGAAGVLVGALIVLRLRRRTKAQPLGWAPPMRRCGGDPAITD